MNKNQATILTAVVAVVLGGLIAFLVFGGAESSTDTPLDQVVSTPAVGSAEEELQTSQPVDSEVVITDQAEIELEAVNGYEGTATATRQIFNGEYSHSVLADIGDPAEGKFYEGWIVGDTIVSTGKLTKESLEEYSLSFTGDAELIDYDQVVITEETEANGLDGIPEAHVFEGSF